ncbi:protein ALP1-like [Sesamum indicum]|uniref:Protein ALP1-like n=1 Tax=Sesamum indicum TaxID=4182 RepID=A0A6I9UKN2_SESIN|nr:protein ALP1-like [Sesamum indicum]
MRSITRVTVGLIVVSQIIDELVVALTIFSFVINYLAGRNPTRRLRRARSYTMATRIPDQIHHLHRLVSISDESCLRNLRMDRNAFGRLCYILQYSAGLTLTKNLCVAEQVAIFLSIVSHHKKNSVVKHDFIRSGRTIHRHFHRVLNLVIKLYNVLLAKPTPISDDCVEFRWKWFKGCLGALDGTFINVRVPEDEKGRNRTRKGHVAVNVLGVCNPNMQFIYVLSGWEGSAADSRVLRDAVHRPGGLRIPSGNYYLCDNGYANAEGFLTPYRGVRYHLRDWDTGVGGPQNYREFFNLKHASAHNVIERTFGLLKMRWGILRSQSFYSTKVQSRIILACCLQHNFLRQEMPDDPFEADLPTVGVEETEDDGEIIMDVGSDEGSSMPRRRGGNRDRPTVRRVWTTLEEECLIAALRNLVVTGWKCENGFRNGYLGQLEAYILKHFPHSNIKADPHITSKLHV